jgi:hypothetical protein
MITIAISMLFGLAAFAALVVVTYSVLRGIASGRAIQAEIAGIDTAYGRKVSRPRRLVRQEFAPLWPQHSAAA